MGVTGITFQWEASPFFGWGVYGLNLALRLGQRGLGARCLYPLEPSSWAMDPARMWALRGFVEASESLVKDVARSPNNLVIEDHLVLHAFGNDLKPSTLADGRSVAGRHMAGVVFLESSSPPTRALERVKPYEHIIAGSRWNAEVLRELGVGRVGLVLQGVDTTLFHPAPSAGVFDGRFAIFSGGKLEYRKGQDLVLRAFRAFHARHPEALLVTAWQSPWAKTVAMSMANASDVKPVKFQRSGAIDVRAWAEANGIPTDAVVDLGAVPNGQMPGVLRETHAALFPSRCEGGTNLVAMEAMACGVPTILSANTGHLDLIADQTCFALTRQGPVAPPKGFGVQGWGESDVEEMVETLEAIHGDRAAAEARAAKGAAFLASLSWRNQIDCLIEALDLGALPSEAKTHA